MIGIYKITSPAGRVYIGQSWDIQKRWGNYRRLECKNQPQLYNSLSYYGASEHTFEIMHELPQDVSQEILDTYEILYWHQHLNCNYAMLNYKEPGRGGKLPPESYIKRKRTLESRGGYRHTVESRQKISTALKGRSIGPHSQERKNKLSEYRKGKLHLAETRQKISASKKGIRLGPRPKVQCPYCGKQGGGSAMSKYHFSNCKHKNHE
jgi:group I intron endonuclease